MTDQQIKDSAMAGFGHVPGITVEDALVRRIRQISHYSEERLRALNTNVRLAQENERLRAKLAKFEVEA